ncbi:hypothetical protein A1Q1_01095 [Trichosporon asahii var. asahii CBS 2479]|uniref:Uncharacterized protein n=1 Tax=Trichosporon asahii var. asahii (strain ATCC 90039 / CBS 2479 / JCM 2466 / KCTC 7840 / NBRC 103889/ NCYC 2677 / UAMH 7654) TaxID=1186058 RepID=J6EYJ9_TRIAS|nr:hypothetical protein A1Q1_01095 [Trichosporon asahii var. asahii CBS 2479]EJT49739.1 hypothetical protein A1Q1_01095 [Trichosporon asahii var. asahii CBS 2479]
MLARTAITRSRPVARTRRFNSTQSGGQSSQSSPRSKAINEERKNTGIIVGSVALGALGLFYFLQNRGKKDAKWNEQEAAKDKQKQQQRQQKDVDAEHKATKEGVRAVRESNAWCDTVGRDMGPHKATDWICPERDRTEIALDELWNPPPPI